MNKIEMTKYETIVCIRDDTFKEKINETKYEQQFSRQSCVTTVNIWQGI